MVKKLVNRFMAGKPKGGCLKFWVFIPQFATPSQCRVSLYYFDEAATVPSPGSGDGPNLTEL
jgi:hypothetical protein